MSDSITRNARRLNSAIDVIFDASGYYVQAFFASSGLAKAEPGGCVVRLPTYAMFAQLFHTQGFRELSSYLPYAEEEVPHDFNI